VCQLLEKALEETGAQVTTKGLDSLEVMAVETELVLLFKNLISNALKFRGDRLGQVHVEVRQQEAMWLFSVRDNGIGIAPELLPCIFDLFVQGDRSFARSQGGLGIGLTLVRRLVELHGGTIRALSAGLGHGSEFVVRLPVCSEEEPRAPYPDNGAGESRAPNRRILVVDDNIDAAESLAMVLRLAGHEVRTAYSGPVALAEAQAGPPDVVLLDIGLPGMDGFEVARQLRRNRRLSQVLIVAVTGYGQESDRQRTQEAGFDYHLIKPIDPTRLEQVLSRVATAVVRT
jgi:CheY-like chemotaxis protein